MDNRILNINGSGRELLLLALTFAQKQSGFSKFKGWYFDKEKGLILVWYKHEKASAFLSADGLNADQVVDMVIEWLQSADAKSMTLSGWDEDEDHDGHNSEGWRVYCEHWGHVGDDHYTICAVTPAFMWHGK